MADGWDAGVKALKPFAPTALERVHGNVTADLAHVMQLVCRRHAYEGSAPSP
jgi:hypothetical protein